MKNTYHIRGTSNEVDGEILNTFYPKATRGKDKKKRKKVLKIIEVLPIKPQKRIQECVSCVSPKCLTIFLTDTLDKVCVRCQNYQKPL